MAQPSILIRVDPLEKERWKAAAGTNRLSAFIKEAVEEKIAGIQGLKPPVPWSATDGAHHPKCRCSRCRVEVA